MAFDTSPSSSDLHHFVPVHEQLVGVAGPALQTLPTADHAHLDLAAASHRAVLTDDAVLEPRTRPHRDVVHDDAVLDRRLLLHVAVVADDAAGQAGLRRHVTAASNQTLGDLSGFSYGSARMYRNKRLPVI